MIVRNSNPQLLIADEILVWWVLTFPAPRLTDLPDGLRYSNGSRGVALDHCCGGRA
jgi:hypothetical protein